MRLSIYYCNPKMKHKKRAHFHIQWKKFVAVQVKL